MSIILRDGTNPAQLATVDVDGNLHVLGAVTVTGGSIAITEGTASPVDTAIGVASAYAALAAAGITNTGSTVVVGGSIGSFPTTSITGFPPGIATIDNGNASAALAAALTAYNLYAALTFTSLSGSSANLSTSGNGATVATYLPGNYSAGTSMTIPTSITLDAQGNPNAIFVFKAGSTVNLSSGASILLVNGAQPNNVVWVVGSSLTTVATSTMVGTILANTSITLGGGTLNGRAFAGVVTSSGALTISAATNITVPSPLTQPLPVQVVNPVAATVINETTAPSLANGQTVALQGDYAGSLFVKPYRRSQTVAQASTINASTSPVTCLAAQAAGFFADISTLIMTVTAAATTDLAFTITLSDGTANYVFDMDTGSLGTGTGDPNSPIQITFNPPLPATTAATAWTVTSSVSTGVVVHVTVVAVLQKAS